MLHWIYFFWICGVHPLSLSLSLFFFFQSKEDVITIIIIMKWLDGEGRVRPHHYPVDCNFFQPKEDKGPPLKYCRTGQHGGREARMGKQAFARNPPLLHKLSSPTQLSSSGESPQIIRPPLSRSEWSTGLARRSCNGLLLGEEVIQESIQFPRYHSLMPRLQRARLSSVPV